MQCAYRRRVFSICAVLCVLSYLTVLRSSVIDRAIYEMCVVVVVVWYEQ